MQRMSAAQYRAEVVEPALEDEEFLSQIRFREIDKKEEKQKKTKNPGPLEKDIQTAILNRLGLVQGAFFWRENSGVASVEANGKKRSWRAGIKGISDIMGVYKGKMVAIEVKRPGKKASAAQNAFMNRVRECGGVAFVCDDDTNVVQMLEESLE